MSDIEPQPKAPSARRRKDQTDATSAESRAFSEGGPQLAGDTPAELLMDDVQPTTGTNTAAEPAGDGTAAFSATPSGASSGKPLKDAAGQLATAVRDVISGKAGSARGMAKDYYEKMSLRTAEPRAKADAFVRQRPYASLGGAVVVGMILARLLRRR